MNKVSVIIPTYRRAELLGDILNALVVQNNILEILVIDSSSKDGTKEIVAQINDISEIDIKHFNVENNVSRKRNKGIEEANANYLIFLDDDCLPDCNFVSSHISSLSNEPNSVHCGDVFFPKDKVKTSNYIRFKESRHIKYRFDFSNSNLDFKSIVTMNMSITKKNILKNNLSFREDFIGYGMEDNEFGCQIMAANVDIKRCKATITHMENNNPFLFSKKIFHTARDGVYKLKSVNKDYVMELPYSYFFEPDYVHKNFLEKFLVRLFKSIFSINVAGAMLKVVNLFDRHSFLYFPILYKYIFACYYNEGVRKRAYAYRSNSEVSKSWYSDNIK